jgi:hypothetical protein
LTAPLTGSWAGQNASASNLDGTTHGSGTTAERTALVGTAWPVNRPFYDSDLDCYFYNSGSAGSCAWTETTFPSSSSLPGSPVDAQFHRLTSNPFSLCQYDATETKWWSISRGMWVPDGYDTFTADGWTDNDSAKIGVNTGNKRLEFTYDMTDSSNDATSKHITALSNSKWTLEFEIQFSTLTVTTSAVRNLFVGLSDLPSSTAYGSNQDSIGVIFQIGTVNTQIFSSDSDGASMATNGTAICTTNGMRVGESYFVRIVRRSTTEYAVYVFLNSKMSIPHQSPAASLYLQQQFVVASTTTALDELCVKPLAVGAIGGNLTGWIRNMKYWDAVDRSTYDGAL